MSDFNHLFENQKARLYHRYTVPMEKDLRASIDIAIAELGPRVTAEAIRIMIREGLPKLLEQSKKKSA